MIKKNFVTKIFILSFLLLLSFFNAFAEDLTSTNFIVRDPIIGTGGSYGTSTNFKLYGSGNANISGQGSSTNFIGRSGFLYFPFVDVGVLTALQNGVDVDLSWTVSTAGLGFNVSGYKVGFSGVPGGPYSYTTLGLVTTYTYEDITPGEYCYVVETLDSFGNTIGKTNEDCITVDPVISFSISDNSLNFGNLSISGPRYANTSTGSATSTVAHTISAGSNANSGYVITYNGSTLTSGSSNIDVASSVSGDGTPGVEQFGISLSTNGSAIIPIPYRQTGPTRTYVANTTTEIASTSGVTSSETFSLYYLANISSITEAGEYQANITYVATGEF
ncbi:MAG: hypothetical protein WC011_02560 [Candidatus Paceibacterota bacterium]